MTDKPVTSAIRVATGLILCLTLVFLPTGIALIRQHNNFMPILLVNLLLGFTGIGWIVALIWSFTDNTREKRSVFEILESFKDDEPDKRD